MMKRLLCIFFAFAVLLPCMGQVTDPVLHRLKKLHLECEKAFEVNDYVKMGESLRESRRLLDSLKYTEAPNLPYFEGAYFKDKGNFHYSMADMEESNYDKAYGAFLSALGWFSEGQLNTDMRNTLYDITRLYYKLGYYTEALEYIEYIVNQASTKDIVRPYLRPYALCLARCGKFDEAENIVSKAEEIIPQSYTLPQDDKFESIRVRAKIAALKAESEDGNMKEASTLYKKYFEHKKDSICSTFNSMTYLQRESFWLRMHPFITDCYRIESEDASFLYNVALFSKSILLQYSTRQNSSISPTWQDLYKKLKKDECAIEFICYEKDNKKMIGALVLKKSSGNMRKETPVFIRIAETDKILDHILEGGFSVMRALTSDHSTLKDILYNDTEIRQIIWTPELAKEIHKCDKVYFSADGIFHQLAIEYMLPPLLENLSFHRLTSTRELLKTRSKLDTRSVLLCGGVDYMHSIITDTPFSNDVIAYNMLYDANAYFKKLPGAKLEVETIYGQRNNESDYLADGNTLNECKVEELFNKYPIIHVSTHGYFGGSPRKSGDLQIYTSDDILSKSVLILSGAQGNLNNPKFDPSHADGILSAREISKMDLSNVQLFIASACQTGLGKISGDGVYGLQRGLKNAGVQAMIVSLWSVNDQATCYLMIKLYEGLGKGMSIHQAFNYARECMKVDEEAGLYRFNTAKLRGSKNNSITPVYNKPQYRNAFILIDNI